MFSMLAKDASGLITIMPTKMPSAISFATAVWDGTCAYIFGGSTQSGPLSEILRYNPTSDTFSTMLTILPDPVCDMPAIWTGTYAYVFGGYMAPSQTSDKIVRYDPSTDTITVMNAKLPTYGFPVYSMSAVWDGNYAYLFGGYGSDDILKYDPTNDQITTTNAHLPTATKWTSAVWTGQYAYIFGGRHSSGVTNQIVKYDPIADYATPVSATLPENVMATSAVWTGSHAYIFGGRTIQNIDSNGIFKYNPSDDTCVALEETLPTPRAETCAVWNNHNAFIFGGSLPPTFFDDIIRFTPGNTLAACLDIDPGTLNLRSKGRWVTAYIQLPIGYSAADINASTILLNGTVTPILDPKYEFVTNPTEYLVDHDDDGITERMVKFDRTTIQSFIYDSGFRNCDIALTITGKLLDETLLEGTDTITIITNAPFKR